MTAPAAVAVDDALDTLVQQFADPLACLRELVQNSVDAGSRQIDVAFEHADGVMTLAVDDYGAGMDRNIIDTRLTRLFSSAKDGDMTKIGRFGIGFVSVFALEPDAVCVDTGRGGESWRVLFKKDRSFTRISLDEPMDGTRIRIIKAVSEAECAALRARAREVLTYWCKHVDCELYFEDDPISGPLVLDEAPIQVRHDEEGTAVLVGFPTDGRTFAGFYNKGLTLHEGDDQGIAGLAFKVSSRYLEHTLTRDNVLHDDQYARAMGIVRRLAEGPLIEALFERLTKAPDDDAWRALAEHVHRGALPERWLGRAIFPAEGGAVSIQALRRAAERGRLLHAAAGDALTRARHDEGDVVLLGAGEVLRAAAVAAGAEPVPIERRWTLPAPLDPAERSHWAPARAALAALLGVEGGKVGAVELAHFPPAHGETVAVTRARIGEPTPLDERTRLDTGFFARARAVLLNVDHPAVAALDPLAAAEPEFVAYTLAKLFWLGDRLDAATDAALLGEADARRARRLEAGS